MDGPQRSGELFPICICNILRHVHDGPTVIAIINCGNKSLIELALQHIEEVDADIPLDIMIKLKGIRKIRSTSKLRTINELYQIARFPNLDCGIFNVQTRGHMEVLTVFGRFVKMYNRNFKGKYFMLTYEHIDLVIDNGYPKLSIRRLYTKSVDDIINFLTIYRGYSELGCFSFTWLNIINTNGYNKLASFLLTVPELYSIEYTGWDNFFKLIKPKITSLIIPNSRTISLVDSDYITEIVTPEYVDIKLLLSKYPNLKCLNGHIMDIRAR